MKKFSLAVVIATTVILTGCYSVPIEDHTSSRRGAYGDRDRDGVPNRFDKDRDGDGVPNSYDRNPNNSHRK